jgi:hypothetical protein
MDFSSHPARSGNRVLQLPVAWVRVLRGIGEEVGRLLSLALAAIADRVYICPGKRGVAGVRFAHNCFGGWCSSNPGRSCYSLRRLS